MVSIYGRKYNAIFKHVEINYQGRIHEDYHNHNKPATDIYVEVSYFSIYLVIMDLTSWRNAENAKQTDTSEFSF